MCLSDLEPDKIYNNSLKGLEPTDRFRQTFASGILPIMLLQVHCKIIHICRNNDIANKIKCLFKDDFKKNIKIQFMTTEFACHVTFSRKTRGHEYPSILLAVIFLTLLGRGLSLSILGKIIAKIADLRSKKAG
jgi:hypothetical protein